MNYFKRWIEGFWKTAESDVENLPPDLVSAYRAIPEMVIQDLLDNVYCTICPSDNELALAAHNGQRAVVHRILQILDLSKNPSKYEK